MERGVKLTMSELVAGVALMVTLFSALNGWIVLPEQMRHLQSSDAKQNASIEMIQREAHPRQATPWVQDKQLVTKAESQWPLGPTIRMFRNNL